MDDLVEEATVVGAVLVQNLSTPAQITSTMRSLARDGKEGVFLEKLIDRLQRKLGIEDLGEDGRRA